MIIGLFRNISVECSVLAMARCLGTTPMKAWTIRALRSSSVLRVAQQQMSFLQARRSSGEVITLSPKIDQHGASMVHSWEDAPMIHAVTQFERLNLRHQ